MRQELQLSDLKSSSACCVETQLVHMQVVMRSEGPDPDPDLGQLYFLSAPVEPSAAIHIGSLGQLRGRSCAGPVLRHILVL